MAQYLLTLRATAIRRSDERGTQVMYQSLNPFGYEESVLQSDDDFEPYGFGDQHLAQAARSLDGAPRGRDFREVIEASVLAGME
jgi:hypothetical protein